VGSKLNEGVPPGSNPRFPIPVSWNSPPSRCKISTIAFPSFSASSASRLRALARNIRCRAYCSSRHVTNASAVPIGIGKLRKLGLGGIPRPQHSSGRAGIPRVTIGNSGSHSRFLPLVARVEPEKLLADFGGDALHLAQVLLANLAAVGIARRHNFFALGAEESVSQDGFELANAQLCAFDAAEKGRNGRGRKASSMAFFTSAKVFSS